MDEHGNRLRPKLWVVFKMVSRELYCNICKEHMFLYKKTPDFMQVLEFRKQLK